MTARLIQNLAIFAAGVLATLAFIGLYWNSNKDELSQKALNRLVEADYCPDGEPSPTDDSIEQGEASKIYFVGCGGFF